MSDCSLKRPGVTMPQICSCKYNEESFTIVPVVLVMKGKERKGKKKKL